MITRWIAILGVALCGPADATHGQPAPGNPAPETAPSSAFSALEKRLQKLEEAFGRLQQENEALRKEVNGLKSQRLNPERPADSPERSMPRTTSPPPRSRQEKLPFVLRSAKEHQLKLGGFLQANAEFGDVSSFEGNLAEGPKEVDNRIRLRRARIHVSGSFLEDFDFKLEGDFQQGDGNTRTDFSGTDLFLNWRPFSEANLKFGQFKAPFGLEQTTSDTVIFTAERSLPTAALTPERQVGVQIWGEPLARVLPERRDLLHYKLGAFNGNGRNTLKNDNDQFMYVGRLDSVDYSGHLFGLETKLHLGANGLFSRDAAGTLLSPVGNLALNPDGSLSRFIAPSRAERRAWGVDQSLTLGPFDLITEYLEERIRPRSADGFSSFTANGYYVQGSYYFPGRKIQAVAKWESFNPGQKDNDDLKSITLGLNYYIKQNRLKLMLDYIRTASDFRDQRPGLGRDQFNEVLTRLQLLF